MQGKFFAAYVLLLSFVLPPPSPPPPFTCSASCIRRTALAVFPALAAPSELDLRACCCGGSSCWAALEGPVGGAGVEGVLLGAYS